MSKTPKIYPSKTMNPLCEQAGCDPVSASKHAWKWENYRWHSHPSAAFSSWWQPFERDSVSGASVGGHPDAMRCWARKDPGRWAHGWYGISCPDAWNGANYVGEFNAWQEAGSPEPESPFVSVAAPMETQKNFWFGLRPLIKQISKRQK